MSRSASPTDLQKRLAVLGCELRKAEISKRTYEVATQRLLQYAEVNTIKVYNLWFICDLLHVTHVNV